MPQVIVKLTENDLLKFSIEDVNSDSNIIFYEQPTGRFSLEKTKNYNGKSFWSKLKVEKMEHYKPNW